MGRFSTLLGLTTGEKDLNLDWFVCLKFGYPLVNKQFAIKNGHRNSGFTH